MGEICIKCGSLLEDDYLFCGLWGLKRDKNTNSVPSAEKEPGGNDKIEASQTTSNANGAVREQKNTKSQNFLCPNCRTDMPVPVRTGFGMNKRIICSACGISFLKVGADKYRLMSFNN